MADTLCWSCANYGGKCPWSEHKKQRPVPGWKAHRNDILMRVEKRGGVEKTYKESYFVIECPLYKSDGTKPDNSGCAYIGGKWSESHLLRLKSLWESGLTFAEIAESLGRTEAGVRKKLQEIGLKRKPGRKPNV